MFLRKDSMCDSRPGSVVTTIISGSGNPSPPPTTAHPPGIGPVARGRLYVAGLRALSALGQEALPYHFASGVTWLPPPSFAYLPSVFLPQEFRVIDKMVGCI